MKINKKLNMFKFWYNLYFSYKKYNRIFQEDHESGEFTHRWHVNHIPQSVEDPLYILPESELNIYRYSDGRLQVNETILEGEHYPLEGITLYYYTLSNNEILTILYDNANDLLEIIETNDGMIEEVQEIDVLPHYEEHIPEGSI